MKCINPAKESRNSINPQVDCSRYIEEFQLLELFSIDFTINRGRRLMTAISTIDTVV